MASLETLCCVWAVCHKVAPQKLEGGTAVPVVVADHVGAVRRWATAQDLAQAARAGSVEGLWFCWGRMEVAERQKEAQRAWESVAWHGSCLAVVQWLVKEGGADACARNDRALRRSAQNGNLAVVRWLVEEGGADVHAEDDGALWRSAWQGHLAVVQWLVKEGGADVHAANSKALQQSARDGQLPVVRWLVEEGGADVRDIGNFALPLNAQDGRLHMVKWLAGEGGADVHAYRDAALRWSAEDRRLAVVQWLLEESGAEWTVEVLDDLLDSAEGTVEEVLQEARERMSKRRRRRV